MSNYGLTTWYIGAEAEIDVVFVHGLRGDREATWTKNQIIWPKELLSKDVEKSRILSFGYDSGIVHSDTAEVNQGSIESDARSLCSFLSAERAKDGTKDRPIITVAHSLGGLVCAQVIVSGDRGAADDSISQIAQNIKGMVFLSTPFGGSKSAGFGDLMRRVYDVARKTDKNTLKNLKVESQELRDLRKSFPDIIRKRNTSSQRIGVVFFYETKTTYLIQVVTEESATYPGVGEILAMNTNHLDICKFDSADDANYKVVQGKILELIQAETKIQDTAISFCYDVYQLC